MAASVKTKLNDEAKVNLCSRFILQSPSGELLSVLDDIRVLLNNELLFTGCIFRSLPRYNKAHLTPVDFEFTDQRGLISDFNDLGNNRFFDPRRKKSFRVDHCTYETSNVEEWTPDSACESWRKEFEEAFSLYVSDHYNNGVLSVFGTSADEVLTIVICIEHHVHESEKYHNGLWRSIWTAIINHDDPVLMLKGQISVESHYFESGKIHFDSSKESVRHIEVSSERQTAMNCILAVRDEENELSTALKLNLHTTNDLLRHFRRALPITQDKFDWRKSAVWRNLNRELVETLK